MLFRRSVVVGRARETTPSAATAACAAAWAASTPPKVVAGAGIAALGFPEVNLVHLYVGGRGGEEGGPVKNVTTKSSLKILNRDTGVTASGAS